MLVVIARNANKNFFRRDKGTKSSGFCLFRVVLEPSGATGLFKTGEKGAREDVIDVKVRESSTDDVNLDDCGLCPSDVGTTDKGLTASIVVTETTVDV
jgi:hypothetical protein